MTEKEAQQLSQQLARLDQSLSDIKANQDRQEGALVDMFKAQREVGAKVSSLDVVVRMSIAEQKRINEELKNDICDLEEEQKDIKNTLDGRMHGLDRRLAYFAGGLAVLLLMFDLAVRYGLKTIGG
jgi:hypothetical protein